MARRRSRTSATGGNMDSMLDTLTNVVGILIIVLVTVQLSSQEAAERIAAAVQQISPEEIAKIEQDAAAAKAAADRAQEEIDRRSKAATRDPATEAARLDAEAATAEKAADEASKRAFAIEKQKAEGASAARTKADSAAKQATEARARAEQAIAKAEEARATVAAELEKTPPPETPQPKEVRLPDPRPAPQGLEELRVLCREGRVWVIEPAAVFDKVLKRAAPIIARKKLDPDGDNWLTDGKVLAEEFNKDPLLRAGDCKVTLISTKDAFQLVLERVRGSGQTAAEAMRGTGDLTTAMRRTKPEAHYFRFFVWPDGFEDYLAARQFVSEKGFAAGWDPQGSPDEHRLGFYRLRIGPKPAPSKSPQKPTPPPNVID